MKHGLLSAAIFLSLLIASYGQDSNNEKAGGKITGKIIDSSSSLTLEYAAITLFVTGKNKPFNGTTSDTNGEFTLTNIPVGSFNIRVEFIGYQTFNLSNITVNQKHQVINLKNIFLKKKQETLQAVTVTAQGKLIDNKIDKLVFNAERDITSQTGVATDILKKVPQVSVDVDGNVELAGSSSIRFLINGKPSTIFGSNITDVLQSIPANQIKSIEVITNPGAKYDAQGLGGIINIILKHNTAQGINGNVSLTAGTRMENGSFNFNARKGRFGVNAFFSGNLRLKATTPFSSEKISSDSISNTIMTLQQDGENDIKRHGFQTGAGFDWTASERNSFSGSVSFNNFGNKSTGLITQSQIIKDVNDGGNLLSDISTINHAYNSFSEHSTDLNLNYTRTFSKEDQELEVGINSSFGHNLTSAGNEQLMQPKDSLIYGTNNSNPGKENETEINLDYTQPLAKNINLGLGGKLNFYNISSVSEVYAFESFSKDYLFDSSLSNNLDYHQKVYAFYSELSFPVGKILDAKIGGRYERTEVNSFYSNADSQVNIPGYNTFFPSVFLSKKFGDRQILKFSYSKRIERPDYGDLNPFINTSDPNNISTGNPNLKPEIGDRYELSYNRDLNMRGSFMITLFYRKNNNDIQPFIIYYPSLPVGDTTYYNVYVTTRENIGIEKNTGLSLFGDLHFTSKLNVRTNFFFFYRYTINTVDKGYNSHSFNYRFNLNASYQFTNTLVAEFFGNFNSARHEAQGNYPSFISYSMAIRKQFWDKKGSLAITANNIFNEYVTQQTNLFGPGFTVTNIRKVPFRSVGLNFTWKFGKLKFKKEKTEDNSGNLNPPE